MFSSLSIRKKLIIIQTTTAFIAMIICCGLFIYNDIKLFKRSIIRKTSSLVGVIGDNAVSPLLFMDQEAAEEILYNLKDETDIIQANILDKNYRVFGNYLKKDAEKQPAFSFSNLDTLHAEFIGRKLYVRYVIYSGKEILGYVCLISQPNDLQKVINNYMGIAGTVILITLLITFVISYFFQQNISSRLLSLVNQSREVALTGNYTIRSHFQSKDEIGTLSKGFNAMLDQIESMETSLKNTNSILEERVKDRTLELETANRELRIHMNSLRDSEEQINTIFSNAPDAVIVINAKGIIIRWNKEAEKIFGWKVADVLGSPLTNILIPQRYREGHINGLNRYLSTGHGPVLNKRIELPALKQDGTEFEIEITISPVKMQNESFFIAFLRDITDRKKAEATIRQKSEELLRSNQELESFSYSVSHDLKAPLRAIHSYSSILKEDYLNNLDPEANRINDSIIVNSEKMAKLIEDLLAFSRLRAKDMVKNRINMDEIVRQVVKEAQALEKDRKIIVNALRLPPTFGDQDLIRQVWTNLIFNAFKYTRQKENAEITIGYFQRENETVYYVKDNGAGFDMKYQNKLFGVFQRLHTSSQFEGTGVGLAIVKRVISRHDGKVWAEGKLDEGATFYFSLPEKNIPVTNTSANSFSS